MTVPVSFETITTMVFELNDLVQAADLFNRKYYFECHDALEELWSEERGEDRAFLQALVHLAVGMVHVGNENHQGAVNLLSRGVTGLGPFRPTRHGLNLDGLVEAARRCLQKSEDKLSGISVEWEERDRPVMLFEDPI